jgi:HPt (histidine-containing phosphotransfer) domain-containing protein
MEYKSFKPEYLENVTGGDRDIMEELISIFRSQIPEFLSEMRSLFASGNYYELGLLAHKAKGSVTVMGMDETAKMLKDFELQAKAGENTEDYIGFISGFEKDCMLVLAEIDHYMSQSR